MAKLFLLMSMCSWSSCRILIPAHQQQFSTRQLYREAVEQAMTPDSSKIDSQLIRIIQTNKALIWRTINGEVYLLMISWKNNVSYYRPYTDSLFYNTGNYPIWVTAAPELKERMKKESGGDQDLRLKQLLGLPPDSQFKWFVEFWVRPVDLLRPCPDSEITDDRCQLFFPQKTDSAYIQWINANRISRYYQQKLYANYPWTQLGYTYDWSPKNKTHKGLSEFVIGSHRKIVVGKIISTADYLNTAENGTAIRLR